jgi:hypothetical protein
MTLAEIKGRLRAGAYAWPGGYPIYFVTSDGAALSFGAVRKEWRNVVSAHLTNDIRSGWHVAACDINYEDPNLYCEHTNERIESAYAEDCNNDQPTR